MFHKSLMKEFKENRRYTAAMVASQLGLLLLNICLVMAASQVISSVMGTGGQTDRIPIYLIVLTAVLMMRPVLHCWNSQMSYKVSRNVKVKMRRAVYDKLADMGVSYRDTVSTSEAVQVSTEGVEQLEIYFGKYVPQFFYSLLAPMTLFLVTAQIDMKIALVLFLCVPLIPVSIVAIQRIAKKLLHKYWGTYTGLGDTFLEGLQGLTTLKIFQADEDYARKMDEEAERFRRITMRVLIMQLNSISVMDLVAFGGAAAGIILSIMGLRAGEITMGQCFFITVISAEFFLPLRLLGSYFHIAMNGNAAADKIFRILSAKADVGGQEECICGSSIDFSHVTFGYEKDRQILNDISFSVPEHKFTAVAGVSGSGKSTIASLIMGAYKAQTGEVRIGGIPVSEICKEALHRKVTRVGHDSYLFQGTVEDNLKMGNQAASVDMMNYALLQVDLLHKVNKSGGLKMQLSEKASNLSGGQRQRLALARALLSDSDIYIFDEASSNIDTESEDKIMKVIHALAKKKTVILISHRLHNLVPADRILMLSEGRIKEQGTHEELMKMNGDYKSLYGQQQELEEYTKEAV